MQLSAIFKQYILLSNVNNNYIIFNNLGLKGGLMYYGALALFCGAVSLFVWLFNED